MRAARASSRYQSRISATVIKPQDKTSEKLQGAEQASSEPKGQELVYAARVSLDRPLMQVENKLVDLSPGMAVAVETKTGSRRIIRSFRLSRIPEQILTVRRLARSMPAAGPIDIHPYQRQGIPWLLEVCREVRGFRPPAALETFRPRRPWSIGRRGDFDAAQARLAAGAREKASGQWSARRSQRKAAPDVSGIGQRSRPDDRDAGMRPSEAPIAFDHGTAHVLPLHHDRNSGPAGHDDHGFRMGSGVTDTRKAPQHHDQVPARIHHDPSGNCQIYHGTKSPNGALP